MFSALAALRPLGLVVALALPAAAWAGDYGAGYRWGQGLGWAGLAGLPLGLAWVAGVQYADNRDQGLTDMSWYFPGYVAVGAAPLAASLGSIIAASAIRRDEGMWCRLKPTAGWISLGIIGGAISLVGLGPVTVYGEGTEYIVAGVYALALVPAAIQLGLNRRYGRVGAENIDKELRKLEEEFGLAPVLGPTHWGLAMWGRF